MDKDFETYSAEPQIVIGTPPEGLDIAMFIAMDPPRHDQQRNAVQGVVAPQNLEEMEGLIRSRVASGLVVNRRLVAETLGVGQPLALAVRALPVDHPPRRHRASRQTDLPTGLLRTRPRRSRGRDLPDRSGRKFPEPSGHGDLVTRDG